VLLNETYELVPAEQLNEHPRNARRGDVDAIATSIRANGFFGTLVAQRSTGNVLVGNHRFRAGILEGMESFPVIWIDCDDARALKILKDFNQNKRPVVDGFCGSGTTVIACEKLGMGCCAMELEPGYVAVTLERLSLMGIAPKLVDHAHA
jgi:ParB-like nuclease domain